MSRHRFDSRVVEWMSPHDAGFLEFREYLTKSPDLIRPHWPGIQVVLTNGHVTPTEVK